MKMLAKLVSRKLKSPYSDGPKVLAIKMPAEKLKTKRNTLAIRVAKNLASIVSLFNIEEIYMKF